MMKILDRYLIREFVVPFFYCLAAFFLIFIIYDLSAHLDSYIEDKIAFAVLLRYYLVQMPLIFLNVIPISILLSIIYSLGKLSRNNEMVAMRASGISIYRIMMPFFIMGILFTMILFFLNENFAPEAFASSERLLEESSIGKKEERMEPLAFLNHIENRTWAARWKPGSKTLHDVSVRIIWKGKVVEKITAEKAQYLDGDWWFLSGAIQPYDRAGRIRGKEITFSKRKFPYTEKPADFLSSQKDADSMNSRELSRNMLLHPEDSAIYRRKLVSWYHKIAFPFVGFTIILIAVPLAITTSRGGAAGSVGVSIAIVILYYVVDMVSISSGRGGRMPPWMAAWLPNMLFSAIGAVLIYRAQNLVARRRFTRVDSIGMIAGVFLALVFLHVTGTRVNPLLRGFSAIAIILVGYSVMKRIAAKIIGVPPVDGMKKSSQ